MPETKHGGSRAGAGRPSTGVTKTKTVRIPESLGMKGSDIVALVSVLNDYRNRLADSPCGGSSPRWDQMRNFIDETWDIVPW